ncbi:hypothetical protein V8E36_003616 [Tilletia maclaganii]
MPGRRIPQSQMTLYSRLVQDGKVSIGWLARRKLLSRSTYYRCMASSQDLRSSAGRTRKLPESFAAFVQEIVLRRPDIYLDEVQDLLLRVTGTTISRSTIQRTLTRRGISRKRPKREIRSSATLPLFVVA